MSYVSVIYNRDKDVVHSVERTKEGNRLFVDYPAEYTFYYPDKKGKHRSVYNDPVTKFSSNSYKEFIKEKNINSNKRLFESDFTPIGRCLEKYYAKIDAPNLNTAFFDIEVDFDTVRGFAPTDNPFNKITAISIYLDWCDSLICLVIPPKTLTKDQATEIISKFDNTFLYYDEKQMLLDFLSLIDDADVLSGWNSEGFDIPYIVNRVIKILSKNDTRKFCLWDKLPKKRTYEKYGAESLTYDLIGRIHMDYMQLYQKYTYHEMHSYSLDAIAEYELGSKKVAYKGTLDELYNKDFKTFVKYSLEDTFLLYKLDKKLKFIDLANTIAHENTVLIPKTMGAVAVTEQAIINESHERGFVVPDKKRIAEDEDTSAAGAYVAYPKKGLHKWIGSVDINSLYPSALRSLNMAPETVIGQLRPTLTDAYIQDKMADTITKTGRTKKGGSFAAAWEGLFGSLEYTAVMDQRKDVTITIDWEEGGYDEFTADHIYEVIFNGNTNWCISANGTIFTLEKEGIIPGLLARWYAERKVMQKTKREATNPDDIAYWDKMQLVKKILLNSLYGAILNQHCRFFDKRIGQSTTLTGRAIAHHMDAHVNECLTGVYDHRGDAIVYGDTDSAYFSAWPMIKDAVESGEQQWDTDTAIALYDGLADEVNVSFPGYMMDAFHTTREKGELIKCGREVVGAAGLFITKKRYAIMVVDDEGDRHDTDGKVGKVKAMGLDLKRSDTLPVVQDFLKDILTTTLTSGDKDVVIDQIINFKKEFADLPAWEKGSPKRVNNLTKYVMAETAELAKSGKSARLPGHVRAGMNFNNLRHMNSDNYTMSITDGMKCVICRLKDNPLNITSVARPTDETNIPNWFKELPFDDSTMEETQINKKVGNLLGVLDWELEERTDITSTFTGLFEF